MQFSIISALVLGLSSLATADLPRDIQAAVEARALHARVANNTGPTTLHLTTSGTTSGLLQAAGIAAPTGQAIGGARNATTSRPQIAGVPTTTAMMLGTAVSGRPLTTPAIVKSGVGTPNSATTLGTSSALATAAIVGGNATAAEAALGNGTVALKAAAGRIGSDGSRVLVSVGVLGLVAVLFL